MIKKNLTVFIGILILGFTQVSFAQDENQSIGISIDFGADMVSRYVWRGTQFGGNTPSLQPGVSLTTGNLEIGAWGAYSLTGLNTGQEFDLYLTYSINDMFSLTLTDYFFPTEGVDYNYFKWEEDATGHVLEATLAFNGTESFPISILFAANVYGADAINLNDDQNSADFNTKDGIKYSNYFELGYGFNANGIDCSAFMGGTLNSVKDADANTGFIGESGFYGNGPGIVNLGITMSKELERTDKFSLPVSASIITNPQAEKIFLVFGLSF